MREGDERERGRQERERVGERETRQRERENKKNKKRDTALSGKKDSNQVVLRSSSLFAEEEMRTCERWRERQRGCSKALLIQQLASINIVRRGKRNFSSSD